MADIENGFAISRLNADDAACWTGPVYRSPLEPERSGLALFPEQGIVSGMRDHDGRLIATAALLPYSAGNAWISMVLVTPDFRRGYRHPADRRLPGRGKQARPDGLARRDARGRGVYGPLGFTPTLQLRRLCLAAAVPGSTIPLATCDLDELVARDFKAIGFDRLI